jgi:transcriptional regulator with XRE-family HTH domain
MGLSPPVWHAASALLSQGVGQGMAAVSPTVRQRELGVRLRQLRRDLGLTVDDVAKELLSSGTKISRIETGARRPTLRDVRDLIRLYKVTDQTEAAELMELARQAREAGWWTQYDDLKLSPYIGLEQDASAISYFSMYFLHGLVQTEEYARAIIKGMTPKIDPKIFEQRVEARRRRQQLLEQEKPPRFRMLLDESVLHRQIGGPVVMAAQLDRILELAHDQKVAVQVIPFEVGAYDATDSNFVYLEFDNPSLRDIVFVEGLVSQLYHERPAEADRYRESIENLRDLALSPRDSASLITEIRRKYPE